MDVDYTNLNLLAIRAKVKNKRELYRALIFEGGCISQEKETLMLLISNRSWGKRVNPSQLIGLNYYFQALFLKEVYVRAVPQVKELHFKDLLKFLTEQWNIKISYQITMQITCQIEFDSQKCVWIYTISSL